MTDDRPQTDRQFEARLDGLLSEEETREFESRISSDPDLREEADLQTRIDRGLRRLFAAGEAPPIVRQLQDDLLAKDGTGAAVPQTARSWIRRLAVAAGLTFALFGGWLILRFTISPDSGYQAPPPRTLLAAYQDTIESGFQPRWWCRGEEFANEFRSHYGQALYLSDLPAGVEVLGLDYCNCLTAQTSTILFRIEGRPVIVFVDRFERDTNESAAADELFLHRKTIGKLVLYEVSPFDSPAALAYLSGTAP